MTRPSICFSASHWLLLVFTLTVACAGETEAQPANIPTLTPFPPDLYLGLSDSAAPLADLVTAALEAGTDDHAPIFLSGNDETLLNDVQQGKLEAAIVHHLPADSQLWFTPVALDGVVVITHPNLDLDGLSSSQLQGILAGSIKNWAEIGGPDLAVNVFAREPGSAARDILQQLVMQNTRLSGLTRIAPTEDFMKREVLATPGAVGYTMMGSAEGNSLLIDGHAATLGTITAQNYPLTTPIYFVALVEPQGPLRDFLAWLQSPDGQTALSEKYGRVR